MSSFTVSTKPVQALSGFSNSLGHILLMDASHKLTDTVHSSEGLMCVIPGEGAWRATRCSERVLPL